MLKPFNCKIHIAKTGSEAVSLMSENDYDLVLMDIMMPEMDGYEAMQAIRDQQQFKDLPIIALTAKAMKGDRERCLEAGMDDYLAKPFDAEELSLRIENLIERYRDDGDFYFRNRGAGGGHRRRCGARCSGCRCRRSRRTPGR